MHESRTFYTPPVVGEHVSGRTEGMNADGKMFSATWSGIYLGIVRSDHDGAPIHLLVDGEINGNPQTCHGFPSNTDPAADLRSSTSVVREWETRRAEEEESLFYVEGVNASGAEERYPADDYLRDTSAAGWPLVTDADEAVETARCALVESEGWQRACVYRRDPDGANYLVSTLTRVTAPAPAQVRTILVHLNVEVATRDPRTAEEIASVLMAALEVGLEGAEDAGVHGVGEVCMALAEEV